MRIGIIMVIGSPWSADTALRLAQLGNEVHVIDFADPVGDGSSYIGVRDKTYDENLRLLNAHCAGVHLLKSRSPSLRYFLAARQLSDVAAQTRIDVLLTLYAGGFATLALVTGFRPYVCYAVGSDILALRGRLRTWLGRLSLANAAVVFANGNYLATRAKELSPRANVVPLLLGVDPSEIPLSESHHSCVEIICTRGFLPVYNNEAIISAIAKISQGKAKFRVTFVSPGPRLPDAIALADSLLGDRRESLVRFVGGASRDELLKLLAASDVYVSMSRSDGTSTALLEALSAGLFPVLSDIPQHHEWLAGENAILAPLDDIDSLAAALSSAITDADRRGRAREVNRKLIEQRADSRATSRILNENLHRVVVSKGRAA